MSKVDAGAIQQRVQQEMQRADSLHRGDTTRHTSPDEALAMFMRMVEQQKVASSPLHTVDLTSTTAQLRDILATEMVKILGQIPGFVAPQLSRPPTPDEVKQLLKSMVAAEKEGLLEKHDAFKATTSEGARGSFLQPDASPIAKAWGQFVQQATNAQTPLFKKEGDSTPQELLSKEIPLKEGTGLRSPVQVGDPFKGLNNKQKLDMMTAGFGRELAMTLKQSGVRDPGTLTQQLATPSAREDMAKALGMSRGQLTVHVARAELLTIGSGRNGEQALRAQHLPALSEANIVTLKQLGAVNGLNSEQFAQVFAQVRKNFSGFARTMGGERPILKKDLQHWAKSAARKKSSLLDADWENMPRKQGDAEEMIMAWYLEHWEQLEGKKEEDKRDKEAFREAQQLALPNTRHDPARDDGLICFWVERPNYDVNRPSLTELAYVCLDPRTGLVDLKTKE